VFSVEHSESDGELEINNRAKFLTGNSRQNKKCALQFTYFIPKNMFGAKKNPSVTCRRRLQQKFVPHLQPHS
jgi:hypothetical protein